MSDPITIGLISAGVGAAGQVAGAAISSALAPDPPEPPEPIEQPEPPQPALGKKEPKPKDQEKVVKAELQKRRRRKRADREAFQEPDFSINKKASTLGG